MPNGEVGIIVDGSNDNTELTINPLPTPIRKGYAHSYAYGQSGVTHTLNIGQITVNSGSIAAIEGFHTANLVGPLTGPNVAPPGMTPNFAPLGTTTVDRIAFNSIGPGASITTGGSLNTLDVLQSITLGTNGPGTGTSIQIGRDLNLLNVGGNITLENGSQILVGRHLGAILQPAKGTGTGSNVLSLNLPATTTQVAQAPETAVSAYIQGNINIDANSRFKVVGEIFYPLYIIGNVTGTKLITFGSEKATAFAPFPLDIQGTTDATVLAITSAASTTFTVGTASSFTVTATGTPTPTVIESSTDTLPTGVTFSAATGAGTGVLSGTPAAGTGGTYSLHFAAVNTVGSSPTQTFTLTVNQAPEFTSANATTFTSGAGTFTVTTTGFPIPTLTETPTPPTGVTFVDNHNRTATLTGTGVTSGTYHLTFTAANGVTPNATQPFTLTVT